MALNIEGIRADPFGSFNFTISLIDVSSVEGGVGMALQAVQNVVLGGFSECSGLEAQLEIEEYEEGGVNGAVKRFPTRAKWPNLTLKRGVAFSDDLWNWHAAYVQGKGRRRDGVIILQNDLHIPVKVWHFIRGMPAKWVGPTLNASQSAVAVETLEIAHEGLKLYSLGSGIADLTGVSI